MSTFDSEAVAWVDPYVVELSKNILNKRETAGHSYDGAGRYGDTDDFGSGGVLDLEDETQRAIFEKFQKIHEQRERGSVGSVGVIGSGATQKGAPNAKANPNIPGPRTENLLDRALDDPYTHVAAANDTFVAVSGRSGFIHFFDKEGAILRFSLKLYGTAGVKDSGAQAASLHTTSGIAASSSGITGVGFFSNLVAAIEGEEAAAPIDPRDPVINLLLDPLGRHAVVIFASGASILYHVRRNSSGMMDEELVEVKKKGAKKGKKGSGPSASDYKPIRYPFNINSEANGISGFVLESIGWNISNNAESTTDTILFGSKYGGVLCNGRIGAMGLTDARPLFTFPAPYNRAGPIQSIAQYIDESGGGARSSIVLVAQGHRLFYFSRGPVVGGSFVGGASEAADTTAVLQGIFLPFANATHLSNFLSLPSMPTSTKHHAFYSTVSSGDRNPSGGQAAKGRASAQQEALTRAIPVTADVNLILPFAVLSQRRQQELSAASDNQEAGDAKDTGFSSIAAPVMRYGDTSKRIQCLSVGGNRTAVSERDYVAASEVGADSPLTDPPICFSWSYDQWYVTGIVNLGVATVASSAMPGTRDGDGTVGGDATVDEVGVAHMILSMDLTTGPAVPSTQRATQNKDALPLSPYYRLPSACLSVINVIDMAAIIGGYESLQWRGRLAANAAASDGGSALGGSGFGILPKQSALVSPAASGILTSVATLYSPSSFYSLDRITNVRSTYFHTTVTTTRKQYTLAMPPYLAWEAANLLHVILDAQAPAIVATGRNMMHSLHVPAPYTSSAHQYIQREQKMLSSCVSSLLMSVTAVETTTRGLGRGATSGSNAALVNVYRPYASWPAPPPALTAMGRWSGAVRALTTNASASTTNASGFLSALNANNHKSPQEMIAAPTAESYSTIAAALATAAAHETRNRMVHEVSLFGHAQRLAICQIDLQNSVSNRTGTGNRDRSASVAAPPNDATQLQEHFLNLSPIAVSIGAVSIISQTQAAALCPGLASSQGQAGAALLMQMNPRCSCIFNGVAVPEHADMFRFYLLRYGGEGFTEVTLLPHRKHFAGLLVAAAKKGTRAEALAIQIRKATPTAALVSSRPTPPPTPPPVLGSVHAPTTRTRSPSLSRAQASTMRLPTHRVLSQGAASVVTDGKGGTFAAPTLSGSLLFNMAMMLLSSPLRLCRQDPFSRSHYASIRNHMFAAVAGAGLGRDADKSYTYLDEEDLLHGTPSVRAAQGALMMTQGFLNIRYQFALYLQATGRPLQAARHFACSTAADTRYHLNEAVRATTRGRDQTTPYAGLAASANSFNSALTRLSAATSPTGPLLIAVQEKSRILNRTRSEQNKSINTNVFDDYDEYYSGDSMHSGGGDEDEEGGRARAREPVAHPLASPELHCLNSWASELLLHRCAVEEREERMRYRQLAYQQPSTNSIDIIPFDGDGAPNRSMVASAEAMSNAHLRTFRAAAKDMANRLDTEDSFERLLKSFYGISNASNTLQNLFKRFKQTLHWNTMRRGVFAMGIDSAVIHFCTHMKKYSELLQYQISNGRHFEAVIFLINFCSDDHQYYNSCWVRFSYDLIREFPVRLIQEGWVRKGAAMGLDPLKLIPAIMAYRPEYNDTRRYAEGPAQALIEEMETNRLMSVIRDQIVLQKAIDRERTVPVFRPYGQIYRPNLQRQLQRAVAPPRGPPSRRASVVGGRIEAPRTVSVFNGVSTPSAHAQKARSLSMLLTKANSPGGGGRSSFGGDFSSLAVAREQVPDHQGIAFLKHVLKSGALSAARSDPTQLLKQQCLYNLLLHLLATSKAIPDSEVVHFIETTPTLDKTYAYRVCMASERHTAALQILFSLGYLHEAVEQALGLRDVGLAVSFIKKIRRGTPGIGVEENGRSTRRDLWKRVIAFAAEDKVSGAQFALNLIAESKGDVNVSHVLPFLSDEVNVSAFKNELDENVRIFGNDLQTLQMRITQSERESEALKAEQRYEASLVYRIDQKTPCAGCGQLVLSRRNAIFFRRCRHAYHTACFRRGCINVLVAKQLLDQNEIDYVEGHMRPPCELDLVSMSNHASSNAHKALALLGNGTNEQQTLAYSLPPSAGLCPTAGAQQGFFPAPDLHDKRSTSSLLASTEFKRAADYARDLVEGRTVGQQPPAEEEEYSVPERDCQCYLCDPTSVHAFLEAPLILPVTAATKRDVMADMRL